MNGPVLSWLNQPSVVNTALLVVIIIVARLVIMRVIKGRTVTLSDTRRRWLSIVQNTSLLLALLGLVFIWSPQLSTFALSLTAFAVALVIATKEYLLCIMGGLYRATSSAFSVGDWIQVQGQLGEVLTEGILSTRVQEVSPNGFGFTGRILVIPNSVFLTQTVLNETFRKTYRHHTFRVMVEPGLDPAPVVERVRERLSELCPATDEAAERHWTLIQQRLQSELPPRAGTVGLETTDIAKITFRVTAFCATERAATVEAEVTALILGETARILADAA